MKEGLSHGIIKNILRLQMAHLSIHVCKAYYLKPFYFITKLNIFTFKPLFIEFEGWKSISVILRDPHSGNSSNSGLIGRAKALGGKVRG